MEKEEKIAEFVGIMLGDGCIGKYPNRSREKIRYQHRVKVTLDSRNKEYTGYVSNLLREVLGIEPKVYYKKSENTVDIAIYQKEIYLYVINNIGLLASPKWNRMSVPLKYQHGKLGRLVLKGLFDTDGCVTLFNNNGIKYPRIEIRLSPSPAQDQINNILLENSFSFRIQKLERGKTKIRISGKNELKKWFDIIGSSNPIHAEKANQFLKNSRSGI